MLYTGFGAQVPRAVIIVLAIQYVDSNHILLLATQIADGIQAAVGGVACMVVTEILTEGSGRFGAVSGVINMLWAGAVGISNISLGFVADYSYKIAFIVCGVICAVDLIILAPLRIESKYLSKARANSADLTVTADAANTGVKEDDTTTRCSL
jgi:hypothetical protein